MYVEERKPTLETSIISDSHLCNTMDHREATRHVDGRDRIVPTVTPSTSDNWAWALIVLQMFSDEIWAPGRGQVRIENKGKEVNGNAT